MAAKKSSAKSAGKAAAKKTAPVKKTAHKHVDGPTLDIQASQSAEKPKRGGGTADPGYRKPKE